MPDDELHGPSETPSQSVTPNGGGEGGGDGGAYEQSAPGARFERRGHAYIRTQMQNAAISQVEDSIRVLDRQIRMLHGAKDDIRAGSTVPAMETVIRELCAAWSKLGIPEFASLIAEYQRNLE